MKTQKGDLLKLALDGRFDVIIHGCNCQCQMGKGIALSIKKDFPEAYEADCKTKKGDVNKLGSFSFADVLRGDVQFTIVNAYTQFHWKGAGILVDYEALRQVMQKVKACFHGKRIAYPKIGAGLAGGDWRTIASIIDEALAGEDHTYVEFTSAV